MPAWWQADMFRADVMSGMLTRVMLSLLARSHAEMMAFQGVYKGRGRPLMGLPGERERRVCCILLTEAAAASKPTICCEEVSPAVQLATTASANLKIMEKSLKLHSHNPTFQNSPRTSIVPSVLRF